MLTLLNFLPGMILSRNFSSYDQMNYYHMIHYLRHTCSYEPRNIFFHKRASVCKGTHYAISFIEKLNIKTSRQMLVLICVTSKVV